VAKGELLHWQTWDFYTQPAKAVGVQYVWNSDYRGIRFPKKVTPVLRIKASAQRTYWRATTLDEFDTGNWYESAIPVTATRIGGRDELLDDPELPRPARARSRWIAQEVTVLGLRDNHLIGASVPTAFDPGSRSVEYASGGVAYVQDEPLTRGARYRVWSYEARPTPRQLARLEPRYPSRVTTVDLYVAPHVVPAPPFGAPGRERRLAHLFAHSYIAREYKPMYELARRAVGEPANPYAAALELEGWFRSGAFRYDEQPARVKGMAPLAAFVLRTRSGYCQHFAGAMALLLRYFGIPARVAAGFTSGTYDRKTGEWTVTDHDAHTWVEAWFPKYGWLPFDPTPGRGSLGGSYTASSPHFDLSDGLRAVTARLKRRGTFDLGELRKLGAAGKRATASERAHAKKRGSGSSDSGLGALLKLLMLLAAGVVAFVVAIKVVLRKRRYLTRDPRRQAAACVRELAEFVADQGARAPPSATLQELARLVEQELGVSAAAFCAAAAEARFGPAVGAGDSARRAREELRALRRELRAALTRPERALGLVSLRSLGLTG
jgi:transglutaminase-like putative cysteine protease